MQTLPAINLVGSNRTAHYLSRILVILFLLVFVVVLFAPWRQFVRGTGRVIAFDPLDRRVNIEALVSGRVKKLHVVEGQRVKAGDLLVEIQDNDPNLLDNIRAMRVATSTRIELAKDQVANLAAQIEQEKLAKGRALESAREKIRGAESASETAKLNYRRIKVLFEKGLVSRREYEKATLERDKTDADHKAAIADLEQKRNEFDSKISSTQAKRDYATSSIAKAEEELTKLESELNKNQRQIVTAPRDGIVLKVPVTDGSYLKPGALMCVIIPETESRFVEAWVDGNDVPIIHARKEKDGEVQPGSPVRLAFEGWPAVQAIGWPQLAQGTFAGEVVFIDATDDGTGKFRVVIGPAVDIVNRGNGPQEVHWPSGDRWLRQGVQAKAWVMLDEVPLWFEIWRQINGFPPIGTGIDAEVSEKDRAKAKAK
jgi:multidrug resistance efflux pump